MNSSKVAWMPAYKFCSSWQDAAPQSLRSKLVSTMLCDFRNTNDKKRAYVEL